MSFPSKDTISVLIMLQNISLAQISFLSFRPRYQVPSSAFTVFISLPLTWYVQNQTQPAALPRCSWSHLCLTVAPGSTDTGVSLSSVFLTLIPCIVLSCIAFSSSRLLVIICNLGFTVQLFPTKKGWPFYSLPLFLTHKLSFSLPAAWSSLALNI